MLNILTEPVIRLDLSDGVRKEASLPEVFAALVGDEVVSLPGLRPHQRHAWHAFLVQLGAMAMHRAGRTDLPDIAGEWAGLIRGLTPDFPEDEPWRLVVEDITKPAFMQAPASSKEKAQDFKAVVATPDQLDMLVTSKNHDLKSSIASRAAADDWLFALVTLQTMEGFGGAGELRSLAHERRPGEPSSLHPGSGGGVGRPPEARHGGTSGQDGLSRCGQRDAKRRNRPGVDRALGRCPG